MTFRTDRCGSLRKTLARAATDLDGDAMGDIVGASIVTHGVASTWEQLIEPVWRGLISGPDESVASAHLFSRAMSQALFAARRRLDRAAFQVLLACADEEHHTLPLDALAAALAELGVGCWLLGARVPPQALVTAVRRLRPAAVVIWSQAGDSADPQQITTLLTAQPGPALIPAGPGWNPAVLPARARASTSVLDTLQSVLRAQPPGISRGRPGSPVRVSTIPVNRMPGIRPPTS